MRWRHLKLDLPYLGGELIIVVLGVTIALAAEQWRQAQNDGELAEQYRSRLVEDIESDILRLNSLLGNLELKNRSLDNAQDWIRSPDNSKVAIDIYLQSLTDGSRMAFGSGVTARRITFDELISSGNLDLISSIDIRESLFNYYGIFEAQRLRISNRVTDYQPNIYKLIPRNPEFTVRTDLSDIEKGAIIDRSQQLDLESLIIGERNFGRLEIEVVEPLLDLATQLVYEVQSY